MVSWINTKNVFFIELKIDFLLLSKKYIPRCGLLPSFPCEGRPSARGLKTCINRCKIQKHTNMERNNKVFLTSFILTSTINENFIKSLITLHFKCRLNSCPHNFSIENFNRPVNEVPYLLFSNKYDPVTKQCPFRNDHPLEMATLL